MSWRAVTALAYFVVGCSKPMMMASHVGPNVHLDGDGLRGAEVAGSFAFSGFGLSARAFGASMTREDLGIPRRSTALGLDIGARLSLFGLVADDHRLEHWFDIGASGGAGGGVIKPSRVEGFGESWIGGFATFGLWRGQRYPSLMLEVRHETISSWDDRTVFMVGFSYTHRWAEQPRSMMR